MIRDFPKGRDSRDSFLPGLKVMGSGDTGRDEISGVSCQSLEYIT